MSSDTIASLRAALEDAGVVLIRTGVYRGGIVAPPPRLNAKQPASSANRNCLAMGKDAESREPMSQSDKFKQAARELETDDDPERFKERVGKLVKHKPVEKPE